jgi:hypothetical protein
MQLASAWHVALFVGCILKYMCEEITGVEENKGIDVDVAAILGTWMALVLCK